MVVAQRGRAWWRAEQGGRVILLRMWALSAVAFLPLLAWLLWSERKWRKARPVFDPRIYTVNGRRR